MQVWCLQSVQDTRLTRANGGREKHLIAMRAYAHTEMARRLTVNMDEDLYHEFTVRCAERETNKSDVVRECVRDWLDEDE